MKPTPGSNHGTREYVLWLDDAIDDYHYLVSHLTLSHYVVLTATRASEAIQLSAAYPIKYFLLDYRLREAGVSGIDALRSLALEHPSAKAGFLTNYPEDLHSNLPPDLQNVPVLSKDALTEVTPYSRHSPLIDFLDQLSVAESLTKNVRAEFQRVNVPPKHRRNLVPSWAILKVACSSAAAKAVALVPVLVNAFVLLETYTNGALEGLQQRVALALSGVVALLLSWLTYLLKCPPIVKEYASDLKYWEHMASALAEEGVLANVEADVRADGRQPPNARFYLMLTHYDCLAHRKLGWRALGSALFILGYSFLLWPIAIAFMQSVMEYLSRQ